MPDRIEILVEGGPLEGERFVYEEHDVVVFGRGTDCHVRLPEEDQTTSRHHFLLEVNPPRVRLRDLGSLVGTVVNGRKYGGRADGESPEEAARRQSPQVDLAQGDVIRAGQHVFRVVVHQEMTGAVEGAGEGGVAGPLTRLQQWMQGLRKGASREEAARAGIVLNQYEIARELGRGAAGAVYLAVDRRTGERVALKVMQAQAAVDEHARGRFLRESEVTKALRHPNIVEFRESGAVGDVFYFTMEYCEGGSVADVATKRGGRLPVGTVLPIMEQVLDGMAAAHAAGFIHRDLKPENLLLAISRGGQITKVADFGLAKSFAQVGLSGFTVTGNWGGSPAYTPPEQLMRFRDAKPTADVWALGATLYVLLAGQPPRQPPAGRRMDPAALVLDGQIVPIRRVAPDVPAGIASVIDRALQREPSARYQTAGEMREALATSKPSA